MKAIETKFIGPSNVRGSRYAATDSDGNRVILSADHSLRSDMNHRRAAEALRDKMGWKGELVSGGTKYGETFVFSAVVDAALLAYRYADFSECPEVLQALEQAFRYDEITVESKEVAA